MQVTLVIPERQRRKPERYPGPRATRALGGFVGREVAEPVAAARGGAGSVGAAVFESEDLAEFPRGRPKLGGASVRRGHIGIE